MAFDPQKWKKKKPKPELVVTEVGRGTYKERGALIISCLNQEAKAWLMSTILESWEGAKLVVENLKDLLRVTRVFIQGTKKRKDRESATLVQKFGGQNRNQVTYSLSWDPKNVEYV